MLNRFQSTDVPPSLQPPRYGAGRRAKANTATRSDQALRCIAVLTTDSLPAAQRTLFAQQYNPGNKHHAPNLSAVLQNVSSKSAGRRRPSSPASKARPWQPPTTQKTKTQKTKTLRGRLPAASRQQDSCTRHRTDKARGTGPIKQPSPRATEKNRTAELARTELRRHRAAHHGPGSSRGGPTTRNNAGLRVAVFQPHAQTEPKHVAMQAKTPKPRRPKAPKTHRKHVGPCAGPIRARHELPVPSPSCCVPRPARSCVVRCHRRFAPRPESPADSWAG